MAVCIASDLGKDMAGEPLLRSVSFKLERRDRMALSGRNGAGKTTLLRMLAGEAGVDGGELVLAKGVRVALHDQRPPRRAPAAGGGGSVDISLRDYVLSGARMLVELEHELERLEQCMADGDAGPAILEAYSDAQASLEHAGGYHWRERALSTVHALGFVDEQLDRPLATFSGGELTRGSLARALAGDPDLLLLDEPTNHLDIGALEWLEQHLQQLDAAVVLVAHDRWFLEAVGTAVLELEGGRGRFFKGPWHAWRTEKAQRELALGRAIERQTKEIERMERFVERFRAKATKARQAQSRVKQLDKLERDRITRDPRDGQSLAFAFKAPERSGRVVFELEDGRLEVAGRTLMDGAELWLERGEHVSLVGPNGAGKTTLLHALVGQRELDGGRIRHGHNVKLGFLSQHADELDAGTARTVAEAAGKLTGRTPNQTRALLGRFLFSGEDAEKPLAGLSGGERRRLLLAVLVASGANVLVLDEPTNHLDLESREALEDALRGFEGSVLLVTHDRALLDAVGTRTVAFEDGGLRSYDGGWPEFVRVREERRAGGGSATRAPTGRGSATRAPASRAGATPKAGSTARSSAASKGMGGAARSGTAGATASGAKGKRSSAAGGLSAATSGGTKGKRSSAVGGPSDATASGANGKRSSAVGGPSDATASGANGKRRSAAGGHSAAPVQSKNRRRAQADIEREIEVAETALRTLEAELGSPGAWASSERSSASGARHADARRRVEELYARWESIAS